MRCGMRDAGCGINRGAGVHVRLPYESADLTTKRIVTLQEILYAGGIQGSGIYQEPKMFHRFITGSMSEN